MNGAVVENVPRVRTFALPFVRSRPRSASPVINDDKTWFGSGSDLDFIANETF